MTRGVLVAGGQGRRLGLGMPKALVALAGQPLYRHALETLAACSDEVVIAAPASIDFPVGAGRRVVDREPGGGPLAGVVAAIEGDAYDQAVVLGVDFPFMSSTVITQMRSRLEQHPELGAVVPAPRGRLQPLAAVYTRAFGAQMVAAFEAGERSIVRAIEHIGGSVLSDDDLRALPGGLDGFFNLNTPDDLAEAERRWAAKVKT